MVFHGVAWAPRVAGAGIVLALAAPARADRFPVLEIGGTMQLRFPGHDWQQANTNNQPDVLAGPRVTLGFENKPPARPPAHHVSGEGRVVPELLAGALFGSQIGEAYVGAGVRAELLLAAPKLTTAMYLAARGVAIGLHRDGAGELAFGEYLTLGSRSARIGWEAAVFVRPQDRSGDRELSCNVTTYIGWAL